MESENIAWYKIHRELTKRLVDKGIIKKKSVKEVNNSVVTADLKKISLPKNKQGVSRETVEASVENYLKKGGEITVLKPFDVLTGDRDSFINEDSDGSDYLDKMVVSKFIEGKTRE